MSKKAYDSYTADEIITNEYDNGLSRDEIIVLLVTEKDMTLNAATKAYAAIAKEAGWTTTLVSHKDDAIAYLEERFPKGKDFDAQATKDMAVEIASQFSVADSTARDYMKAFCEHHGMAYPVENPREAIFAWFKDHGDAADKEDFMDYAVGVLGRSQSNANEYWKGYELHLHLIS